MSDMPGRLSLQHARQDRPIGLRPEVAGGLALVGVMLGMASLGGGWLTVGVLGLGLVGVALGFTGSLRGRLIAAGAIWAAASVLAAVSLAFGSKGFAIAGSMVFVLMAVALGQLVGLLAGVVWRRP
jgi:hypothetical protein